MHIPHPPYIRRPSARPWHTLRMPPYLYRALLIASVILSPICARAADSVTAIRWDVETSDMRSKPILLLRGETAYLEPRFLQYQDPMIVTNLSSVSMRYRSTDMDPAYYYSATGTVLSTTGTVRIVWCPTNEAAAINYEYTIYAQAPAGNLLRAWGSIRLRGSVTGTPTNPTAQTILLGDIYDVLLASPSDGQALVYDAATGKWINSAVAGGSDTNAQARLAVVETNLIPLARGGLGFDGSSAAGFLMHDYAEAPTASYSYPSSYSDDWVMAPSFTLGAIGGWHRVVTNGEPDSVTSGMIANGTIDILDTDAGVQASLALADSAVQTELDPAYSAWATNSAAGTTNAILPDGTLTNIAALLGTITYDAAFTNAAETVHESYDGVQVITSAAAIALTPTKSFMELTLTNAPTITAAAAMRRTSHMLTIFGTNTVTMGAQFTLVGTWTQAATNYMTLFPSGQSTNWIYGVRTP